MQQSWLYNVLVIGDCFPWRNRLISPAEMQDFLWSKFVSMQRHLACWKNWRVHLVLRHSPVSCLTYIFQKLCDSFFSHVLSNREVFVRMSQRYPVFFAPTIKPFVSKFQLITVCIVNFLPFSNQHKFGETSFQSWPDVNEVSKTKLFELRWFSLAGQLLVFELFITVVTF